MPLGAMEHVEDERHALTNGHEANHNRENDRQERYDLVENTTHHISGNNTVQRGGRSSGSSLRDYLLSCYLVAGS